MASPAFNPNAYQNLTLCKNWLEGLSSEEERAQALGHLLSEGLYGRVSDDVLQHAVEQLKAVLKAQGAGNLGISQINVTPGDIQGNAKQIIRAIQLSETLQLDAVLFPEMALMGYPIEDVILKHPHLVTENLQWLEAIAKQTHKTKALVGFVEPRPTENKQGKRRVGKPYYNSVAVLGNGSIEGIVRKTLLPNYAEFNDYRTFEPSNTCGLLPAGQLGQDVDNPTQTAGLLTINGIRYGISICEDIWNNDAFISRPLYHTDPIVALGNSGADVLLNLSASPSRAQKEQMKHHMLSATAKRHQKPLVYVNQSGSIDGLNFDGASRAYDTEGKLTARAKAFDTQFMVINPKTGFGQIEALPEKLEETFFEQKQFDVTHANDLARTYQSIVQGIRDYFAKSGFRRAVLGLSGGLDSSVTVVLLADALGPENVIGISMPSKLTPNENKSDAQTLAENLGISFAEFSIADQIEESETFAQTVEKSLGQQLGGPSQSSTGKDNVQAMLRALNLRRIGNDYFALPIATSDKSELYMGYATVNGDMSGALAPIGDVLKTKVRALAHWLNDNRPIKNAIPTRIIEKPSGADLKINPKTGKLVTAEEDLMPYPFLDEIIWRLEFTHADFESLLNHPFQYERILAEQGMPLSQEQKQEWLEKFYRLMSGAVFKWYIAPPVLIVDGYGITRSEYRRPIVSKLNPKRLSEAEIEKQLASFGLPLFEHHPHRA